MEPVLAFREFHQLIVARWKPAIQSAFEMVGTRVTAFANFVVVVLHFGALVVGGVAVAAKDGVPLILLVISLNVWVCIHV